MLGHTNFKYIKTLCKEKLVYGMPNELEIDSMKCITCIENKIHNHLFNNDRSKAQEILDIVHTDVNGPQSTVGNCGERYFVTFTDDYSKFVKVYPIKTKDQVYDCIVKYINEVENLSGKRVKTIRLDNGTEYKNIKFFEFIKQKGITVDFCPPYVHQLNGTSERLNRTTMEMARCLLAEAKVSKRFWPEIVKTTAYLKNRTLANTLEKKTPYEIFFNKKPDLSNLRLCGSRVRIRVPMHY